MISDIGDFFKCIKYNPHTAITQLVSFYTNKEGKPCITSEDDYKTPPQDYVLSHQSYGSLDAPGSSQIAIIMTPDIFEAYAPLKLNKFILIEIRKWIQSTCTP